MPQCGRNGASGKKRVDVQVIMILKITAKGARFHGCANVLELINEKKHKLLPKSSAGACP
jgi:hypothetical protein